MGVTGLMTMWLVMAVSVLVFHELSETFSVGKLLSLSTAVAVLIAGEAVVTWSNHELGWFDGSVVASPYAPTGRFLGMLGAVTAMLALTVVRRLRRQARGAAERSKQQATRSPEPAS